MLFFLKKKKNQAETEDVEFLVSRESYDALKEWAEEEKISVEDVISKSIGIYEVARHFRKQGLQLAAVNDKWEVQAKLTIPGITTLEGDPSPSADKLLKVQ